MNAEHWLAILIVLVVFLGILQVPEHETQEPPKLSPPSPVPWHRPETELVLVPRVADDAMLLPFRDCPIDELDEAWRATIAIVEGRCA